MLKPANYNDGDIVAMDRAYIDYSKFEELTNRGVIYVTKMKKNLVYEVLSDMMYMSPCGLMEYRVQVVEFKKHIKDGENIRHKARIVTYVDSHEEKAESHIVAHKRHGHGYGRYYCNIPQKMGN